MDRTERFYKIDRLLRHNRVVSLETFLDELSVSRATFKRDLEYLRDRLNAPIEYDRDLGATPSLPPRRRYPTSCLESGSTNLRFWRFSLWRAYLRKCNRAY